MATSKQRFTTTKLEVRKNFTIKVHKAGYSDAVGMRLPSGVSVVLDIAGILGKSAKKLGKHDPVVILFNFSRKEMRKLSKQIEKGMG